jgi:hypothetical protein
MLLEELGAIHIVHEDHHHQDDDHGSHEHSSANHQFADGDYITASGAKFFLNQSHSGALLFALVVIFTSEASLSTILPGPAPPGATPVSLTSSWQFQLRTALPVRAPSILL